VKGRLPLFAFVKGVGRRRADTKFSKDVREFLNPGVEADVVRPKESHVGKRTAADLNLKVSMDMILAPHQVLDRHTLAWIRRVSR